MKVLMMVMSLLKMMVKMLWKRKVMMRHGCVTKMRRGLTLPCFGEEAVGGGSGGNEGCTYG